MFFSYQCEKRNHYITEENISGISSSLISFALIFLILRWNKRIKGNC